MRTQALSEWGAPAMGQPTGQLGEDADTKAATPGAAEWRTDAVAADSRRGGRSVDPRSNGRGSLRHAADGTTRAILATDHGAALAGRCWVRRRSCAGDRGLGTH